MNDSIERQIDLFCQNRDAMRRAFRLDSGMMLALCALLTAGAGRETDAAAIKQAKRAVKQRTGAFSPLRSYPLLPLATIASGQADPDAFVARAVENYRAYRKAGFPSSYYVAIAAYTTLPLPQAAGPDEAYALYREIRRAHSFLASQEDAVSAVLLASLPEPNDVLLDRCAAAYEILQPSIRSRFGCWQLAKCLAMSEEPAADTATRAVQLYEQLNERGVRTRKGRELTALAVPVLSGMDVSELADRIAEVDAYLKQRRGFSAWTMNRPIRAMFACALVSMEYAGAQGALMQNAALSASITAALVAATTAALIAATSASAAAASSGGGD